MRVCFFTILFFIFAIFSCSCIRVTSSRLSILVALLKIEHICARHSSLSFGPGIPVTLFRFQVLVTLFLPELAIAYSQTGGTWLFLPGKAFRYLLSKWAYLSFSFGPGKTLFIFRLSIPQTRIIWTSPEAPAWREHLSLSRIVAQFTKRSLFVLCRSFKKTHWKSSPEVASVSCLVSRIWLHNAKLYNAPVTVISFFDRSKHQLAIADYCSRSHRDGNLPL